MQLLFECITVTFCTNAPLVPDGYINTELITENWDNILRLITSIKLKECSASQIFKRLNSYSRQPPVYQALKEYGKIIKTLFILKYIDDVELGRSIRRQLNKIEHSNRFSAAICFANNGELIFLTRQEQLVAESCKRLIKNAIICWNYLYLTHCIQKANKERRKKEIVETIKSGSTMAWKHIYFHGLYDFSDEKLVDSFNLTASKNYRRVWIPFWGSGKILLTVGNQVSLEIKVGHFVLL